MRPMDSGSIEKNNLRVRCRSDSGDAIACGLGFGSDDGDFLSQELIKERRFPNVGPAYNGDHSGAVGLSRLPGAMALFYGHDLLTIDAERGKIYRTALPGPTIAAVPALSKLAFYLLTTLRASPMPFNGSKWS